MRGKKTDPEIVYKVMASWAITNNISETSRKLKIAESTVRKIVNDHKEEPEFVKLCEEKREKFSERAGRIIDSALNRVEQAVKDENKQIPINHLTNLIGVLYDKKALADGKPTERAELIGGDKLNKLAELAGYERKQK